jgi:hypothetical protein
MDLMRAPNLRQAALTLHAMTDIDREWVLNALDASQRSALEPLLRELREIGMPSDTSLLTRPSHAVRPLAQPYPSAPSLSILDRRQLGAMRALLREEPAAISAALGSGAPALRASVTAAVLRGLSSGEEQGSGGFARQWHRWKERLLPVGGSR